jgi:hypothetical protein
MKDSIGAIGMITILALIGIILFWFVFVVSNDLENLRLNKQRDELIPDESEAIVEEAPVSDDMDGLQNEIIKDAEPEVASDESDDSEIVKDIENRDVSDDSAIQRTIDIEKLKTYLVEDIFTKKSNQKSKADALVNLLKTEGLTQKEFAEIAKFIYENGLRKERYKHSLSWTAWLSTFYEVAGVKNGYSYRIAEISDKDLSKTLAGLFEVKFSHK